MEVMLKYFSEEDKATYEKWNSMGLIPEDDNIFNMVFLAKTYENFCKFLLELPDVQPTWWGESDFTTLFIPITKKLYMESLTNNHELIYKEFEKWYNSEGKRYTTDLDIVNNFVEHFRKSLKDNIKDDVKQYCIINDKTVGIAKPQFKKDVLLLNLKFEKRSDSEKEQILNELLPLFNNDNFNICYFPIYKINNEVYVVSETKDTIDDLVKHINNGDVISVYSGKFNDDGNIVYRCNINNK